MKKRFLAVFLVMILAFGLAACESGSTASVGTDTAAVSGSSEEEIPEIPTVKGEATVDVGDFTVTVPEGWLGAADLDVDENGKYFIEPYYYVLIKGGESYEEQGEKPTVTVFYSSSKDAQTMLDNNMSLGDENTELEVTVNGTKCLAYHSIMNFSGEDEEPFFMEYDNVFIPVSDSSCLRLTMLTYTTKDGDTGVNAADADVIKIMESLKVN